MTPRAALASDLPAIAALHIANWRAGYRGVLPDWFLDGAVAEEMAAKWTAVRLGRDLVLVLCAGDDLAGFVAVAPSGPSGAYLDNLHVARPGGGLVRILMAAAVRAVMARGDGALWLKVLEGNAGALDFYARLGGEVSEPFEEDLMGLRVRSRRVSWSDLGGLYRRLD